MHNIFTLLKSFTKEDVKIFYKFLSSPYFNTNEQIVKLYKELIKYYPIFSNIKLNKINIYKRIYNNKTYNDSTMRNLLFRLEKLIDKFLIIENNSQNKLTQFNSLLNELNQKLLKDKFLKTSKALDFYLSNSVGIDYDYFYNKYSYESNKYNFYHLHELRTNKSQIIKQLDSLNKANIYLSIYFITETICNYLSVSICNFKYLHFEKDSFVNSLVKSIDFEKICGSVEGKDDSYFILKIYISLLRCFSDIEKEQNYFDYKSNIEKYLPKLSTDEISFHYSKLINYCILKINQCENRSEFKTELFNIYKIFLKKKYFKNRKTKYLPQNLFRSILFLALNLKELKWCRYFIDKYNVVVEPLHKENMLNFGNCFYYFHTCQYEKSIAYSKYVTNEYFMFKHDINNLSLRTNFILYNPEEIYRIIHKYHEALREDKFLKSEIKKAHMNFIAYCKKLVDIKEGSKKIELGLVKQKLSACKNIIHKEWLLKEYDKLTQKN